MSSTGIWARPLLLVMNDVWVNMVLARRFGQVPETGDYSEALERAAGRAFAEREVSVIEAELVVWQQLPDGDWNIHRPRWRAADFDCGLSRASQDAHEEIMCWLEDLPSKPFDLVYLGAAGEDAEAALRAAGRDSADPQREITVATLPGEPAVGGPSFRRVDAVRDLGAFPGLDFSRPQAADARSAAVGGEARLLTELDRGATISLHSMRNGPLFSADEDFESDED